MVVVFPSVHHLATPSDHHTEPSRPNPSCGLHLLTAILRYCWSKVVLKSTHTLYYHSIQSDFIHLLLLVPVLVCYKFTKEDKQQQTYGSSLGCLWWQFHLPPFTHSSRFSHQSPSLLFCTCHYNYSAVSPANNNWPTCYLSPPSLPFNLTPCSITLTLTSLSTPFMNYLTMFFIKHIFYSSNYLSITTLNISYGCEIWGDDMIREVVSLHM